jgi:hypothetical protein
VVTAEDRVGGKLQGDHTAASLSRATDAGVSSDLDGGQTGVNISHWSMKRLMNGSKA